MADHEGKPVALAGDACATNRSVAINKLWAEQWAAERDQHIIV